MPSVKPFLPDPISNKISPLKDETTIVFLPELLIKIAGVLAIHLDSKSLTYSSLEGKLKTCPTILFFSGSKGKGSRFRL